MSYENIFYIMYIFTSGSSCWNSVVFVQFLFCFVFQHIAKQEEAHVLPANIVVWVPVLHAPGSPPPIKLIDPLRLKGSHFSLYTQQAQDHPSQVIGAQEEPANMKETVGEGSSMAFSSGKKRVMGQPSQRAPGLLFWVLHDSRDQAIIRFVSPVLDTQKVLSKCSM